MFNRQGLQRNPEVASALSCRQLKSAHQAKLPQNIRISSRNCSRNSYLYMSDRCAFRPPIFCLQCASLFHHSKQPAPHHRSALDSSFPHTLSGSILA